MQTQGQVNDENRRPQRRRSGRLTGTKQSCSLVKANVNVSEGLSDGS